jgi:hypothetical protein
MRKYIFFIICILTPSLVFGAACTEDEPGVSICDKYLSRDANATNNPNILIMYPNVGLSSPPTCNSVTNSTVFDSDNTSGRFWVHCSSTVEFTGTDDTTRVIIKGNGTQTSNLQEWRNSSDSVKGSVSNNGAAVFSGVITGVGFTEAISTKTTTYQITTSDSTILANGTFDVTLPTAAGIPGRVFTIKNIGTGMITVKTTGGQNIDGESDMVISARYNSLSVISDGSNWFIK